MFDLIKELAAKRNLNLKQLALTLGYSENYFYTLKHGVSISGEKLATIASFFNVSTDYLLGRTDVPEWATQEDVINIDKALERNTTTVAYNGIELTEEEKQRVNDIIRTILWEKLSEKRR